MKPRLPRLLRHGRHVVTNWLINVHSQDGSADGDEVNNSRALWASCVNALVLEAFSASRISELYAIITEYPDSAPAVEELQRALEVCLAATISTSTVLQITQRFTRLLFVVVILYFGSISGWTLISTPF